MLVYFKKYITCSGELSANNIIHHIIIIGKHFKTLVILKGHIFVAGFISCKRHEGVLSLHMYGLKG
jgi:hypothetical protein